MVEYLRMREPFSHISEPAFTMRVPVAVERLACKDLDNVSGPARSSAASTGFGGARKDEGVGKAHVSVYGDRFGKRQICWDVMFGRLLMRGKQAETVATQKAVPSGSWGPAKCDIEVGARAVRG